MVLVIEGFMSFDVLTTGDEFFSISVLLIDYCKFGTLIGRKGIFGTDLHIDFTNLPNIIAGMPLFI